MGVNVWDRKLSATFAQQIWNHLIHLHQEPRIFDIEHSAEYQASYQTRVLQESGFQHVPALMEAMRQVPLRHLLTLIGLYLNDQSWGGRHGDLWMRAVTQIYQDWRIMKTERAPRLLHGMLRQMPMLPVPYPIRSLLVDDLGPSDQPVPWEVVYDAWQERYGVGKVPRLKDPHAQIEIEVWPHLMALYLENLSDQAFSERLERSQGKSLARILNRAARSEVNDRFNTMSKNHTLYYYAGRTLDTAEASLPEVFRWYEWPSATEYHALYEVVVIERFDRVDLEQEAVYQVVHREKTLIPNPAGRFRTRGVHPFLKERILTVRLIEYPEDVKKMTRYKRLRKPIPESYRIRGES